ncbi:MAG: hypothetical protein JO011_10725 [Ktedonobacteraceae bacterium]|nr:hypothetical protein [Ktedonobacteraceae bacterium]
MRNSVTGLFAASTTQSAQSKRSDHLHLMVPDGVGVPFRSPLRPPPNPFNQGGLTSSGQTTFI